MSVTNSPRATEGYACDLMIGRTEDGGTTVWTLYGRDDMTLQIHRG